MSPEELELAITEYEGIILQLNAGQPGLLMRMKQLAGECDLEYLHTMQRYYNKVLEKFYSA